MNKDMIEGRGSQFQPPVEAWIVQGAVYRDRGMAISRIEHIKAMSGKAGGFRIQKLNGELLANGYKIKLVAVRLGKPDHIEEVHTFIEGDWYRSFAHFLECSYCFLGGDFLHARGLHLAH